MAGKYGEEMMDQGMMESESSPTVASGEMEEFFIPKDFLGKKECKPGDTITLEVTQLDDDGDVGVKVKGYSHQSEEMEDDRELRAAFGEKEEA